MSSEENGRLVLLSGPSCVGKTPLFACLSKFYPDLSKRLHKLVLVNSRDPRPGEIDGVDYHFRTRTQVEALRNDRRYVVLEVRTDLQALNMEELESLLRQGDALFEGNPYVARELQIQPRLAKAQQLSVFISPLARAEIEYLTMPERNLSLEEEDSENWDAFYYPIGDAGKTLHAFVALLRGSVPPNVEHWDENLLHRV
jgi:guanylate kinase